jgi:hypothetical protein
LGPGVSLNQGPAANPGQGWNVSGVSGLCCRPCGPRISAVWMLVEEGGI